MPDEQGEMLSRGKPADEHCRCCIVVALLASLHLITRLKHELVHDLQNLLVRLKYPRVIEVPANFAEHVPAFSIDGSNSKAIGVAHSVHFFESELFAGPKPKQFVMTKGGFKIVKTVHQQAS